MQQRSEAFRLLWLAAPTGAKSAATESDNVPSRPEDKKSHQIACLFPRRREIPQPNRAPALVLHAIDASRRDPQFLHDQISGRLAARRRRKRGSREGCRSVGLWLPLSGKCTSICHILPTLTQVSQQHLINHSRACRRVSSLARQSPSSSNPPHVSLPSPITHASHSNLACVITSPPPFPPRQIPIHPIPITPPICVEPPLPLAPRVRRCVLCVIVRRSFRPGVVRFTFLALRHRLLRQKTSRDDPSACGLLWLHMQGPSLSRRFGDEYCSGRSA